MSEQSTPTEETIRTLEKLKFSYEQILRSITYQDILELHEYLKTIDCSKYFERVNFYEPEISEILEARTVREIKGLLIHISLNCNKTLIKLAVLQELCHNMRFYYGKLQEPKEDDKAILTSLNATLGGKEEFWPFEMYTSSPFDDRWF